MKKERTLLMGKIDLIRNTHFEVTLENEEAEFYAILHFHHEAQIGGPEVNVEKIHGYMLDPRRGSLQFTLRYDPSWCLYFPLQGDPHIDTLILNDLNEAIKKHLENLK